MKAKNIICYSLIVTSLASVGISAAFLAPSQMYAEEESNNETKEEKNKSYIDIDQLADNTVLKDINYNVSSEINSYYTEEELLALYEEAYDNDYYRDGFNKYIKTGLIYDFDTIGIKKPISEAEIYTANSDFDYKLSSSIPELNSIKPLRTSDNQVAFCLNYLSSFENSNVKLASEISNNLKSIFQGSKELFSDSQLSLSEQEYCTAIAVYLSQNNISFNDFINSLEIQESDEKANIIVDNIKSLLDYEYSEKNISIEFSDDIELKEDESEILNVYSGNHKIITDFKNIDVRFYDTVGINGIKVKSNDIKDDPRRMYERPYESGDTFYTAMDLSYVNSGINNILGGVEKEIYPQPYKNNYKIIAAGDDISMQKYSDGNNEFYIVQDETKVQLFDYDLHPEKYYNQYQRTNIKVSVIDNDTSNILSNVPIKLFYKSDVNSEEFLFIADMETNEDGFIRIDNAKKGQYKLIAYLPGYVETEYNINPICGDTIDYTYLMEETIALESINPIIKVFNDEGYDWSNHSFRIVNYETGEGFKAVSNSNGEIFTSKLNEGLYTIYALDGEYNGWNRVFEISGLVSDNYYEVDFSIPKYDNVIPEELKSIEDSLTVINRSVEQGDVVEGISFDEDSIAPDDVLEKNYETTSSAQSNSSFEIDNNSNDISNESNDTSSEPYYDEDSSVPDSSLDNVTIYNENESSSEETTNTYFDE